MSSQKRSRQPRSGISFDRVARVVALLAFALAVGATLGREASSNVRDRAVPREDRQVASETAAAAEDSSECGAYGFDAASCGRVRSIVSRWRAPEFAALPVVGVPDPAGIESPRPDPRVDQANAQATETERVMGPCRYSESGARVEVQKSALNLSEDALAKCLATAFAQSRYRGVEARWLAKMGVHEAWIVRGGQAVKVEVDRKLEKPAARTLWTSFASNELLAVYHAGVRAAGGRSVASVVSVGEGEAPNPADVESAASSKDGRATALEGDVRELLGLTL